MYTGDRIDGTAMIEQPDVADLACQRTGCPPAPLKKDGN